MLARNQTSAKQSQSEKFCRCGSLIEEVTDRTGRFSFTPNLCRDCEATEREISRLRDIRQKRQSKAKMIRARVEMVIPPLYRKARLRDISSNLRKKILSLQPGRGLYLWGAAGTGKTYTMCAVIRYYISKGLSVKRICWDKFCLRLRNTFSSNQSELSLIQPLIESDVLVIEDIGTSVSMGGRETDFSLRTLLVILDDRMEHCRATFLTSNKSIEEIQKSFDERIASRIQGTCEILKIAGKDKRIR